MRLYAFSFFAELPFCAVRADSAAIMMQEYHEKRKMKTAAALGPGVCRFCGAAFFSRMVAEGPRFCYNGNSMKQNGTAEDGIWLPETYLAGHIPQLAMRRHGRADAAPGIGEKAAIIRTASLLALLGNLILSALKIVLGIRAGSLAVLGDGIDSGVDVMIAVMSLIVARVISRPADEEHPWGHGRAETVATTLLACTLFFAGGQLVLNSAQTLIFREASALPEMGALAATVISIAGKLLLAWSQYALGKKAGSSMLKANAKNMAADVLISVTVLAGLVLTLLLDIGAIDRIAAILVGLWVIRGSVEIFLEANAELMDSAGREYYAAVFDAVRSVPGAGSPHRTRMRRIAGLWDIDIDIEVAPDLSVREAHRIASRVEHEIKRRVEGVYDIMVHVEPEGDHKYQHGEGFGLSESGLEQKPQGRGKQAGPVPDPQPGGTGAAFPQSGRAPADRTASGQTP
jgi:cation diffusion facilitator family transporter